MTTDLDQARARGVAPWSRVAFELPDTVVFEDAFPVTPGHLLFVPRHNQPQSITQAFAHAQAHGMQMLADGKCDGYNIGINSGEAAGQTVMYPHVHLIPRRTGDMEDPRGGVRHVIPERGNYRR